MSAPVDVREVMLTANEILAGNGSYIIAERLGEASGAVAELIEADREFDKASRAWDDARFSDWEGISDESRLQMAESYEAAAVRRADALARVGGAS